MVDRKEILKVIMEVERLDLELVVLVVQVSIHLLLFYMIIVRIMLVILFLVTDAQVVYVYNKVMVDTLN